MDAGVRRYGITGHRDEAISRAAEALQESVVYLRSVSEEKRKYLEVARNKWPDPDQMEPLSEEEQLEMR